MEKSFDNYGLGTIPEDVEVRSSDAKLSKMSMTEKPLKPEGREGDGLANAAALVTRSSFERCVHAHEFAFHRYLYLHVSCLIFGCICGIANRKRLWFSRHLSYIHFSSS